MTNSNWLVKFGAVSEIAGRDFERLNQRFEKEVVWRYEGYISPRGVKLLTLRKWAEYVVLN